MAGEQGARVMAIWSEPGSYGYLIPMPDWSKRRQRIVVLQDIVKITPKVVKEAKRELKKLLIEEKAESRERV